MQRLLPSLLPATAALLSALNAGPAAALSSPAVATARIGELDGNCLVQRASDRNLEPSPTPVAPVRWVHIPKCGSSFINSLMHLPGACPGVPEDLLVSVEKYGQRFLAGFVKQYQPDTPACPGLRRTMGHFGIGEEGSQKYLSDRGRFMMMLREPRARLMSAYKDLQQEFAYHDGAFSVESPTSSWGGWPDLQHLPNLRTWANYGKGCGVRLLTRNGSTCGGAHGQPSPDEVALAKRRVREDFAFVGLTDEWKLSVCLLDAMFGTGCRPTQFADIRPGPDKRGSPGYDVRQLRGLHDPDMEVYEVAKELFWARVREHGLNNETCKPCWSRGGVS